MYEIFTTRKDALKNPPPPITILSPARASI
jgi:hypothetical protein